MSTQSNGVPWTGSSLSAYRYPNASGPPAARAPTSLGFPLWSFPVSGDATPGTAAGSSDKVDALQFRSLPPVFESRSVFVVVSAVGPSVVASAARIDVGDTSA